MTEATRKLVLRLKEARDKKHLSYRDIIETCEQNGDYISLGSVRRVFEPGSEDKTSGFRASTLEIIFKAVIGTEDLELTPDEEAGLNDLGMEIAAENAALKALVELRDAEIAELRKELGERAERERVLSLKLATTLEMFDRAIEAIGRSTAQA